MDAIFTPRLVLTLGAIALLTAALGIARLQLRAKSCPVHNRRVGTVAWIVAGGCGLAGLALLICAQFVN